MMSRDCDRVSALRGRSLDVVARCRDVAARWRGIATDLRTSLQRAAIGSQRGRIRGDLRRLCHEVCSSRGVSLDTAERSGDVLARSPDLRRHGLNSSRDEPASAPIRGLAHEVPGFFENIRRSPAGMSSPAKEMSRRRRGSPDVLPMSRDVVRAPADPRRCELIS